MTGTLLVIEDQPDVRENIAELLELAGHRVLQAANGIEGVRQAKLHLPDLVLCDIMMPELDGYGVAEVLSRQPETSSIPFLFLTAKAERQDFRKGLALGAVDYITKPFESHELIEAVGLRLKQQRPSTPAKAQQTAWDNWVLGLQSEHPATLQGVRLTPEKLDRGRTVYSEGEWGQHLYFLREGSVRLERSDSQGKRLLVQVVRRGEFFGWTPDLGAGNYLHDASTIVACEVLRIPLADVRTSFLEHPAMALEWARRCLQAFAAFEATALSIAYGTARENTARALLRFAESGDVRLSREDLAHSVGMASESVIRTLALFKAEGLVSTAGRTLVLRDADGLEDELS